MAIQRLENELRATGNPADLELADRVAAILKDRGKDLPQPTKEGQPEIKRFTSEAREALEKQGYIVYSLTEKSIKTIIELGRPIRSSWHKDYPDFEAHGSMRSEVAINPKALFLPESYDKTLPQQEAMVAEFSQVLEKKVPSVKALIGDAADYVELVFLHLDATRRSQSKAVYLFGERNYYNETITKTPVGDSSVARVGSFTTNEGLRIGYLDTGDGHPLVSAAPLIIPV